MDDPIIYQDAQEGRAAIARLQRTPEAEAGCWVDGHFGIYGPRRVVRIAEAFGWQLSPHLGDDAEDDGEAELWAAEEAEAWLNDNITPEGWAFGWHEGEFFFEPVSWWEE